MTGRPTVMHVDDDADLREITRLSLELVGDFNLIQFDSGTKAVEAAPGHDPDLILLDVMMPGLDGVETLKALRKLDA
ncbi:MAG: response regulator, partial [Roseovarius sp.]